MRATQPSNFSSGQSGNSFVRTQLNAGGMNLTRPQQQQQRFQTPNEFYNNPNNMSQQTSRMPVTGSMQQTPYMQTSSNNSAPPVPQEGIYLIMQVRSAGEFYGLSQNRESELRSLSNQLADYYNNASNDSSLNVNIYPEGTLCVVQQNDKYHRVTIKNRDSESRVTVKLIDHGDEIVVDTTELLQIPNRFPVAAPFAQPFRLRGYEESQSSANMTHNLKKFIYNQRVSISQVGPGVNGFYPVEVTLNNQSVNKLLLSNDKSSTVTSPISNNRPTFNQGPAHIESQVFSNSNRHHSNMSHDASGRSDMGQRTNDILPPPQKILTGGSSRTQPGRFGTAPANQMPPSNDQIPRFSNATNRNQQQVDSMPPISTWNKDQNTRSNFSNNNYNNNPSNSSSFGRQQQPQQSTSSPFGLNRRMGELKVTVNNDSTRSVVNQQSSFETRRPTGNTYGQDERNERQTSGNNFQQNTYGTNDSGFRRGGPSGRGGRGGFNDRNIGRNDENNTQPAGGFSNRNREFGERGGRGGGGHFQDRNNTNRDDYNDNNMQRSQHSNDSRGGFRGGRGRGGYQNRGDQRDDGNFGQQRGGRGGSRGGGYGNRGGSAFNNRNDTSGLKLSSDNDPSTNTFSGWPGTRSAPTTATNFEAGDRFSESEIPKQPFKFVVSNIETTNDFFIQLLSKAGELSSLSDTLQNEFKQSPQVELSAFKLNQACLAKSSDNCWYRAIVLSTGLTKLKVRFIDFGDTTDVDSKAIRQIAKKHCSSPPYAYRCTFKNVQVVDSVDRNTIVDQCAGKEFNGKIQTKTSDGKYLLESDDLLKLLVEINAIKVKPEVILKRFKCIIGHIEKTQQEFYIQDDEETLNKIADLIEQEEPDAPTLSIDEVQNLDPKTIVIARYEDEPFRGIISQSNQDNENLDICFIDFGNTSACPKNSLKRCSEQLSSYPPQAKHCRLHGVPSDQMNTALDYIGDNSDTDNKPDMAIVNEKDGIKNVLVYIKDQCINEKFGYDPNAVESDEQAAVTPSTNVQQEQQKPNEEVLKTSQEEQQQQQKSEEVPTTTVQEDQADNEEVRTTAQEEQPTNEEVPTTTVQEDQQTNQETPVETSEIIQSETEDTSSKYLQGVLTHLETDKPYVYLQFYPESEAIIAQIEDLIKKITDEDKHNSSYTIGDHVIAKYSVDDRYYRARIESYLSTSETYTVYFLDYGNIDENLPMDSLYSYSDELKEIEPQAHGYLLEQISLDAWNETVRNLLEENLNEILDFSFSNDNTSTIYLKILYEHDIYDNNDDDDNNNPPPTEGNQTFQANICSTDNDCFYIHILPDGNLHANELDEILQTCNKDHKDNWTINDVCIVSNEENHCYRGQILEIIENKYNVKCIDYGNILQNVTNDRLYVLPDEEIFKQSSLAHQCRLNVVDDANQVKAIEEVIKQIPVTERVTIVIETNRNDQYWFVKLVRENNDIVNDRYLSNGNDNTNTENENKDETNNEIIAANSSESISINPTEEKPSENPTPTESTENDSVLSITNNQTIDFGENDPSTTIKDETKTSISSN